MYRRFHDRFGTAGVLLGVIAMITALAGTAYAAGGLTKAQEKQVTKIAKKYAGKPGATGAVGPAGPAGAVGKEGAAGKNGTNGTNGTNGEDGETGFTEFLPEGKTETGEWAMIGEAYGHGELAFEEGKAHLSEEVILNQAGGSFKHFGTAVSFNIPLESAPAAHYLRTSGEEPFWGENPTTHVEEELQRPQPACPGTAAAPAAEPGNLCVYASAETNTATSPLPTLITPILSRFASGEPNLFASNAADPYGFGVFTFSKEAGPVAVVGTWAVTAE